MTTGVPIYLVSACSSPEEFVAAFRRYIDRSGVFVPIAEPFSVGRRARLALTLVDGGVMIEGDAEVVAAATKPSALHGRIGMTIRFVDADEPSKIVIAEIEKARLVMKPPPPAVVARPATLPEGPRPIPPPVGGRVDAANALAECVARGDIKPAVPAPIAETGSGGTKSGPKFTMPAIPGAPADAKPTAGAKATTLGVAPLDRPKGISGPIPAMIGRRDPRLPLTPRVVPNAAGTPPLAVPNVARVARPTSEPPKSDEPAVGRAPTPTKPEPALGRTPTPSRVAAPTPTKPEPAIGRTPTPSEPAIARTQTPAEPDGDPAMARTSTQPDPVEPPAMVHATVPVEPAIGRTLTPTPLIARVSTPTAVEPPPSPPSEGRTSTKIDAAPPGPTDGAIAQSRTSTRLASVPPVVAAVTAPASGAPSPEPAITPVPEPEEPIVAKPAPASEAAGAPTVKSIPAFVVGSTEIPTEPSLARNETIRGMKPLMPPARTTQSTPPPIPVATTRPMASTVAPATVQSAIPTIDPDDVEIADPTDLTEIPLVMERKTSLGVGAVGPDDGLGPVRDTTVMPAEKRPETREIDAIVVSPPEPAPLDEPAGDWTMKPDQSEPTPLSADATAAARGKQPSGDWTITPAPDSLDGWSDPGAVPKPGPPKSEVASEVALDSSRRPEPKIGGDEPKVQIDPTLIEPLPDLSERPAAALSSVMGGMAAVPVEAPPMPMPYGAPMYPTPSPGSVVAPMYPTPVPQPYSQTFAPSASGAQVIPGPEQQMALLGFPQQQLVVQQSGTSGFFPYATDSSPRMTRAPGGRRTRILVIAISAALVVLAGVVVVIVMAGKSSSESSTDAEIVQIVPEGDHGVQPTTPVDAAAPMVQAETVDAAVPPPAKCYVDLTSSPDDAEIVLDKDRVAGRTPLKVELPCGSESKILVRKHNYLGTTKTVTATTDAQAVSVALVRAVFQLKLSSSPAGATITVNGKSGGVTPAIVKVNPFEATTIVMSKDGFSTETEKLTPKTNNQTVHLTLKRKQKLR